jgi:hypothetical protein
MQKDTQILAVIDRVARNSRNVAEAIEGIRNLLAREIGGSLLVLEEGNQTRSVWSTAPVTEFISSSAWPFRAFYVETLTWRGRTLGRLVACFGSYSSSAKGFREITRHVAERLSEAIVRIPNGARHPEAA